MTVREEFLELLRTDQAFREEVRRQLLTDHLLSLPERFDRLSELVHELADTVRELVEAQRRTEQVLQRHSEQIEALIEAQRRTEETLRQHSEQIGVLIEAQREHSRQIAGLIEVAREMSGRLLGLMNWREGEDARRRGERFERRIIRQAPFLFAGGRGGSPEQPSVQEQLTDQLAPLMAEEVEDKDNPFLADLIWWKNETIAVVEVSYVVSGDDIERAARRADLLRRSGAEVVAIIIGNDWAEENTPGQAMSRHVEWRVGASVSEGFVGFRRLSSS